MSLFVVKLKALRSLALLLLQRFVQPSCQARLYSSLRAVKLPLDQI